MASKPETIPSPPRQMPTHLQSAYTMNGRIPIDTCYIDESSRNGNQHYTYDFVEKLIHLARNRQSCNYGDTDQWLYAMLERFPITGKKILIMGSQIPFYEAICIAQGAHPTTVEFQMIHSDHTGITAMTLDELVATPVEFDAGISISTFEHTGLGRYGDPLDPDGDLKAMKLMQTRIKPGGLLFLSVPIGQEAIVWNAHRIYGPARIPLLLDGWELLDYLGNHEDSETYSKKSYFQPIIVLRNKSREEKNGRDTDTASIADGKMSNKPSDIIANSSISGWELDTTPLISNPPVKPLVQTHKSKSLVGYYCPSITFPSAGVRRLIRHIAILNKNGYNATLWHNGEEFTMSDLPRVPPTSLSERSLDKNDIIVIPEGYPKVMYDLRHSECRRFVIALNWDYIFTCLPDNLDWRPLHGLDHNQYAAEIRNASLFLNLSTAEGFPTSCIEAMQAGTLVAGFDGIGGQGLLNSGENCFLAPNADYPGLAYILAPIIKSLLTGKKDEWQHIITNGLKTAAAFTPWAEEISLLKFWESVI